MNRSLRPTFDIAPCGVASIVVRRAGSSRRAAGAVGGLLQPVRAPH